MTQLLDALPAEVPVDFTVAVKLYLAAAVPAGTVPVIPPDALGPVKPGGRDPINE
jgi:hypothetical protein